MEFYKDRDGYAKRMARNLFNEHYGLAYGSYNWRIIDIGDEYKIIFYTSLCSDPEIFHHAAVWIPKTSELDIVQKVIDE